MRTLKFFFALKKLKKPPSKVTQKNLNPLFFSLLPWAAKTDQTDEYELYIQLGLTFLWLLICFSWVTWFSSQLKTSLADVVDLLRIEICRLKSRITNIQFTWFKPWKKNLWEQPTLFSYLHLKLFVCCSLKNSEYKRDENVGCSRWFFSRVESSELDVSNSAK